MTRSARRILFLGLLLTAALVVVATVDGAARVGPVVFWAVHHTTDAEGSTVALRPGFGLLGLWAAVLTAAAANARRRDV